MLDRYDHRTPSLADLVSAAEACGARFAARAGGEITFLRSRTPDELLTALRARREDLYAYLREWEVD